MVCTVEAFECNPREPQWFCNNYLGTFCHINSKWTDQDLWICVLAAGWLFVGVIIHNNITYDIGWGGHFSSIVLQHLLQKLKWSLPFTLALQQIQLKLYLVLHRYGLCFVNFFRKRGESLRFRHFLLWNSNLSVTTKVTSSVYLLLAESVTECRIMCAKKLRLSFGEVSISVQTQPLKENRKANVCFPHYF